MSLTFAQDRRLPEILDRLRSLWPLEEKGQSDPLSQLVFMIIASKTPGALALATFHRLRQRFPRWHDLQHASAAEIVPTLRGIDRVAQKAAVLPAMLHAIEEKRGLLDLDFLGEWSTHDARAFLESLPGVDATNSAATLNFSTLRRTVLSVTRETARPIRRLNIVEEGATFSALDRQIMDRMPTGWKAKDLTDLHKGLEQLARKICHDGRPACKACPLNDLCPTAKRGAGDVVAFPGRAKKTDAQSHLAAITKPSQETLL